MYKLVDELTEKWDKCEACGLVTTRKLQKEAICMGRGSIPARLLIIVPRPRFTDPECPTPYQPGSEEYEMLKQITDKVGIDRQQTYITSTVACKPADEKNIQASEVAACRPRLCELSNIVNPEAVMLLGPEAMFAWTGLNVSEMATGRVRADKYRHTIWTSDFTRYLEIKRAIPDDATVMAKELFIHWKEVADFLR